MSEPMKPLIRKNEMENILPSEAEITDEIKRLLTRLGQLYEDRRRLIFVDGNNVKWAWCAACGFEAVLVGGRSIICDDCEGRGY